MKKTENPSNQCKSVTWPTLKKQLLEQTYVEDPEEGPEENPIEIEWRHRRIEWGRKDHEEYLKWLEGFFKKDAAYGGSSTKSAKKLQEVLLEINRISPQLLNEILKACYRAARYDPDSDPAKEHRKKAREFKCDIAPQLTAIKRLCKIWKRYPDITNTVVVQAYVRFRSKYQTNNNKGTLAFAAKPLSYGQFLQALLEEFSQVLEGEKIMGKMGDSFLPEFLVGPLRYPRSLKKQRAQPQARENGLLFHLTMLFRWATDKSGPFPVPLKAGSHMPQGGKPHYPLVAFLAKETLGRKFLPGQVRDRIRELTTTGVEWVGWPSRPYLSPLQK